jgi:osmotically-inducible protein OsmY
MSENSPSDEKKHPSACDLLHDASEGIMESALECLRHSSYPELCKITCQFYQGVLTLNGAVASYFLKQIAHATVAGVKGIEEIVDRLEVKYPTNKSNEKG